MADTRLLKKETLNWGTLVRLSETLEAGVVAALPLRRHVILQVIRS
jgi:hypothetical protein